MAEHAPFIWFSFLPLLSNLPPQVSIALFVLAVLTLLAYLGFRQVASSDPAEALIPSDRLTLRNIFELLAEAILKFVDDIIGPRGREFLPLIGTLGFFILFSNLLGLVPGFLPPTDNLNTTVACALIVFFATHYYGIKAHGFRYIKHFLGPVWWLSPLIFIIEIITHLARPLSLSMRLFGNIMADHMLLSMALLAPSLLVLLVSPLAMVLGVFVSLIQTFIFILLSTMYISFAIEEAEH
ncbi:MAG: F0F1 ATP synthase subunit A [Deltaproteobacteria bacterium]|nr:F0F1 ATP synthase subunit A [Deltaproteobacteria bacterium]